MEIQGFHLDGNNISESSYLHMLSFSFHKSILLVTLYICQIFNQRKALKELVLNLVTPLEIIYKK